MSMKPRPGDASALKAVLCGPTLASLPVQSPRFLLVDDEPRLLRSLYDLLDGQGFTLATATSGEEAITQLTKQRFDLVLLDLGLPGISGHGVLDFIRERDIDCHVIVLSGKSEIDAAIGALRRGAYDYLRKPYASGDLHRAVTNALQARELASENRRISAQLQSSERLYRYLVDSSPDIIYTLDQQGRFTFVNDRVTSLLGYERDALLGRHYSDFVYEEDLERALYVFNERRVGDRASRNVELRLKCAPGREGNRYFENSLLTIAFNSEGIYLADEEIQRREYFGTYGVARDISDRKRAEAQIAYQAYHDLLTDLPNRALFQDRLGLAIMQARRNHRELAVMFVDLDRFKIVNDSLGHLKGDHLLRDVATRLKQCLRQGDTLARHGGDEFTLVLPDIADREDAEKVARKVLAAVEKPFDLDGHEVFISASIGIAVFPEHGSSGDQLVRHADIAMYRVKGSGKNDVRFFSNAMLEDVTDRVTLEKDMRRALESEQFEVFYQPQIDVETSLIVGAEALIRWRHPERGLLSPVDFLPFAEENGQIGALSTWLQNAACRDLADFLRLSENAFRVSINVSPQSLERGEFSQELRATLERHAIPADRLEIEITENICIQNTQHASEQLQRLHLLGVSTAIDDFGTGYSSLSYLQKFCLDTLKIDQSFVREIVSEQGHYPVILAIISIARGLGLKVVAEGVETDTQVRYLCANGCRVMQGYRFSPPVRRNDLAALLARQHSGIDQSARLA